ncbi:MAG TPA: AAA family ATPase [Candidatus Bilamarchaeaceae archaeon]|nr:AAA family ATPase [Candidatus Bilamarchaeaceae archaeon]
MEKRVIAVISGKGGVGKSTLAVNTASLLSMYGASTILIDADFYNPCVNFHLGLPPHIVGLQDLLQGKAMVEDAIIIHPATGLRCISASLHFYRKVNTKNFSKLIESLNYDYVIIDCAPGLSSFVEDAIDASNELFILMTPDIPSVTAAMKLISLIGDKSRIKKIHFILNRVSHQPYELNLREIQTLCKSNLQGIIPEDNNIFQSISLRTPVVIYQPSSPAARVFKNLFRSTFSNIPSSRSAFSAFHRREGPLARILNFFRNLFR